jgi:hypothetical protein
MSAADGNSLIVPSLVAISSRTLLIAAAALIAACGDTASSTPAPATKKVAEKTETPAKPPPSDTDQLDALLQKRASALVVGDSDAFVKTATASQVAKDERAIAAAKALPIGSVRLKADATDIEGDTATLRVDMSYTFEDIDTTYYKTSRMTAQKTPDGWRISRDRPSAGTLAPWEYTRYKARTSKHFLALAPTSLNVGSLMKDLEKGRSKMIRGLPGVKPPAKALVIVARSGKDTNALTKDMKTKRSLVAVAETQYSVQGEAQRIDETWGARVFVLWRSYRDGSPKERQTVVAHELVHAALAHRTSARTPPWLYEGIAMFVSGDNRAGDAGALISGRGVLRDASKQGEAKAAMSLNKLSNPRALRRMSSVEISFAYAFSSAAAYTIADKYGRKALLRLFTAYNSDKNKGSGRKLADRVVRKTLHTSLKTLETEVDAYASARSKF